jgi:hypothetical protein
MYNWRSTQEGAKFSGPLDASAKNTPSHHFPQTYFEDTSIMPATRKTATAKPAAKTTAKPKPAPEVVAPVVAAVKAKPAREPKTVNMTQATVATVAATVVARAVGWL